MSLVLCALFYGRSFVAWIQECRLEVAPFKGHRHLFGLYRVVSTIRVCSLNGYTILF